MSEGVPWQVRMLADNGIGPVARVLGLARLHQGDGFYLVAWDGDEPIGHAHLALRDPPELQDVSVRPEWRRRGGGSVLTGAGEREAAGRGHEKPALQVGGEEPGGKAL